MRSLTPPGHGAVGAGDVDALSDRELSVLRLAARGLANEAIALQLGISARTAQAHLSNIFSKMHVESRTQAVVEALRRRWIRLEELEP
jgi:NarL family two-component system response regulator LiaR